MNSYVKRMEQRIARRVERKAELRERRMLIADAVQEAYSKAVPGGNATYIPDTGRYMMSHDRIGLWSTEAQVRKAIDTRDAAQHARELGGDDD